MARYGYGPLRLGSMPFSTAEAKAAYMRAYRAAHRPAKKLRLKPLAFTLVSHDGAAVQAGRVSPGASADLCPSIEYAGMPYFLVGLERDKSLVFQARKPEPASRNSQADAPATEAPAVDGRPWQDAPSIYASRIANAPDPVFDRSDTPGVIDEPPRPIPQASPIPTCEACGCQLTSGICYTCTNAAPAVDEPQYDGMGRLVPPEALSPALPTSGRVSHSAAAGRGEYETPSRRRFRHRIVRR